ncbi:MAG TPA: YegS/Rv2252/BmrU family lipid kinase [Nocardioides sp.]|uniref:YegS/Rv2252/BmrU family lipid kinase n=1 Tax=Nocardioides sp. TaxID=35761 RepID=UPI002ED93116
MLTRPRLQLISAAAACVVAAALLAVMVETEWGPLIRLDERFGHAVLGPGSGFWHGFGLFVEDAFATIPMLTYTLVLAALLYWKNHRRAAVYFVLVQLIATVTSPALKNLVSRDRPLWQDVVDTYTGLSYPSGHALHAAAFAGGCIVLLQMFVRRPGLRRTAAMGCVVLAGVIGWDRFLLGRHHLSDVLGGLLLGVAIVLLVLLAYSPLPRSHALKAPPLPEVFAQRGRCAVVLNPIKVESVGQFQSIVNAMAVEAGWNEPRWYFTTPQDSGTGQAEQAALEGAELVIVCGGDGTVREVCAELAGTGIPVGIVPAGTGNLLARNLAIPLYLRAAIDVALTGQDRAIDMVAVEGDGIEPSHFLVMAGMGFDAAIMEGVNEDIKKRIGWVAYVLSALKALMFPAIKVEVAVDGGEFTKHRARTVVVGNVGSLQGGMPLLPDAEIDDGLLDVVLLHPQRFVSWLPLAFRVLTKRSRTDELVNRMRGHSVVIRADRETPRQLDGDTIGPGKELRMTNVHGRLLVRVAR